MLGHGGGKAPYGVALILIKINGAFGLPKLIVLPTRY